MSKKGKRPDEAEVWHFVDLEELAQKLDSDRRTSEREPTEKEK